MYPVAPISCLRLCARAHHARPIPHRHPSHRHLLIALARHALPALPASPAHTPLPRFAPGSCAHIVRQLKTEMSGGTVRDLIGSWHLLRGLSYPTHSQVKFAAPTLHRPTLRLPSGTNVYTSAPT
jgi:hypothetical protein